MAVEAAFERLRRLLKRLAQYRNSRQMWKQRPRWRYVFGWAGGRLTATAAEVWPGGYVRLDDGHFLYVPAPADARGRDLLGEPFRPDPLIGLLARPGDTVLDIGANHGEWLLPFARQVGPSGHVHAFEPIPDLARALDKSLRLNGYTWAVVHDRPLAATPGPVRFVLPTNRGLGGDTALAHVARTGEQVADALVLEALTLDQFAVGLNRLDVVKIDVEGFEEQVLRGGIATLQRFRPRLVMETGHEDLAGRERIATLLRESGYDLIGVAIDGGIIELNWGEYAAASARLPVGTVANLVILPRG